jgi:electron transport complex protein RnfC
LRTFPLGGIHPPENKLTAGSGIRQLPVPGQVNIPIYQHIGAPPKIIVERGQEVLVGQLLASGEVFISAGVHSSVSGKVVKIENVTDISGYKRTAVVINVEGDRWMDSIDRSSALVKKIKPDSQEIIQTILKMGIVGMGGATFPTHVKLSLPRGKKAEYLLVNGSECEPYLTSDNVLMMEKADEILCGATITMKALKVKRAIIGIEANKRDAIDHLRECAAKYQGIEVQELKVKYPQGGEKQLIKAVTRREVPSGALPIDVGAVVFNVSTMFAVYEAVQKNKPLFERVVTISGKYLENPGNYLVRIGTPVSALIDAAGGMPENTGKVISGGPMMGKALNSLDVPVIKGTSGVTLLSGEESRRKEMQNCIRCTRCVTVCPMGLEPYLLMALGEKEQFERMEHEKAMDCIECGSCSYICPSSRPLLDYIRLGKSEINKMQRARKK